MQSGKGHEALSEGHPVMDSLLQPRLLRDKLLTGTGPPPAHGGDLPSFGGLI
jgi:hypothetical protein